MESPPTKEHSRVICFLIQGLILKKSSIIIIYAHSDMIQADSHTKNGTGSETGHYCLCLFFTARWCSLHVVYGIAYLVSMSWQDIKVHKLCVAINYSVHIIYTNATYHCKTNMLLFKNMTGAKQ